MKERVICFVWFCFFVACSDQMVPVIHGPGGSGRLSLALSPESVTSALLDPTIAAFRIRLFDSRPKSVLEDPYFYSMCSEVTAGFTVDQLKTGTGFTIVYEGYADKSCNTLIALGIRGNIAIQESGSGDAYYYIQVNRKGAFTAFPLPGDYLNPPKGGLTCSSDEYCRELVDCPDKTCPYGRFEPCDMLRDDNCECPEDKPSCQTGTKYMAYRLHPSAICDTAGGGVCRLPSLFPLNVKEKRAFHVAVAQTGGRVEITGGVNFAEGKRLSIHSPASEGFDGSLSLFYDSTIDDTKEHIAFATPVLIGDGSKMVLIGGQTAVGMGNAWGGSSLPIMMSEDCEPPSNCSLSSAYSVVDLNTGVITQGELPFASVGSVATAIKTTDGQTKLFVRTGLLLNEQKGKKKVTPGTEAYICTVETNNTLSCESIEGTQIERATPIGVCLKGGLTACEEYLVIGGNAPSIGADAFGEVFISSEGVVKALQGDNSVPPSLFGAVAVVANGEVWTFGGSTKMSGEPDMAPMSFIVDLAKNTIVGKQAVLEQAVLQETMRVFHKATMLADGKNVLITGGIKKGAEISRTALLFSLEGSELTLKAKPEMTSARFGHSATLLKGGLLDGVVLISGGLTSVEPGAKFASGAELYVP